MAAVPTAEERQTQAAAGEELPAEAGEGLYHIKELLETSRVEEARAFSRELAERWPDVEPVQHFARVLAPAIVRTVPGVRGRSLEAEHRWLKAHAREFPGCWMAVLGDRLICADPELSVVRERLAADPALGDAILFFHPLQAYPT